MLLKMLRAKLHMVTVTHTVLNYHGSITIDEDLIEASGLLPNEAVLVANVTTGQRAETYVIKGERGKREIQLNGAMARLAQPGDRVIVIAFCYMQPEEVKTHHPKVVICDVQNHVTETIVG